MWNPFRKAESPRTEPGISRAFDRRSTNAAPESLATATVQAAITVICRAFEGATVTGDGGIVKPWWIGQTIRRCLEYGESCSLIDVKDGMPRLSPVSTVVYVYGDDPDPSGWQYRLGIQAPSDHETMYVDAGQVVHLRFAERPQQPWRGLSPASLAFRSFSGFSSLESSIAEESDSSTGSVLSLTGETGEHINAENFQDRYHRLGDLRGSVFLEFQGRERGTGTSGFAKSERIGPSFGQWQTVMRTQLVAEIAAVFGVPPGLIGAAPGDGAARREDFRRFVALSVQPLAKRFADELSMKLERDISFDFNALRGSDSQGLGRAVKSMVDAGMSLDAALAAVGLNDGG